MGAELSVGRASTQPASGRVGRLWGDERLAREIAAGNDRAFAMLFDRYHQQLYRYCRSLTRDEQDAEDALQSALTKALVALRADRRNAPLRPWLYRIAHNESISLLRGRPVVAELMDEHPAPRGVAESVEERERLALLLDDLRELPERQRGALVMRELNGLSHEEIAQALEVSVGAAKQTILEARRSLLEFTEGRALPCEDVQRVISDDDRRSLRSRRVRAHLRGCTRCSAFAAAIPQRRADLQALCPVLPAAGAAGLLAKLTGAGSGHGGGGAGLMAGSAAKGLGTAVSIKAAATGVAVIATAAVGAATVLQPAPPPASHGVRPSSVAGTQSVNHPGGASHGARAGAGASRGARPAAPDVRRRPTTPHSVATHGRASSITPAASVPHPPASHLPARTVPPTTPSAGPSAAASSGATSGTARLSGRGGAGDAQGHSHTSRTASGLSHASAHRAAPRHVGGTVHRSAVRDHRPSTHHRIRVKKHPLPAHSPTSHGLPRAHSNTTTHTTAGTASTVVTTTSTDTAPVTTTTATDGATTGQGTSPGNAGGAGAGSAGNSATAAAGSGTGAVANAHANNVVSSS